MQVDDVMRVGGIGVVKRAVQREGIMPVGLDLKRKDLVAVGGAGIGIAAFRDDDGGAARGQVAAFERAVGGEAASAGGADGAQAVAEELGGHGVGNRGG